MLCETKIKWYWKWHKCLWERVSRMIPAKGEHWNNSILVMNFSFRSLAYFSLNALRNFDGRNYATPWHNISKRMLRLDRFLMVEIFQFVALPLLKQNYAYPRCKKVKLTKRSIGTGSCWDLVYLPQVQEVEREKIRW